MLRWLSPILVIILTTPLFAEKWTDSSGSYSVQADFVSYSASSGLVKLKREDNSRVIELHISKLSGHSQALVKQHSQLQSKPEPKAEPQPKPEPKSQTAPEHDAVALPGVPTYRKIEYGNGQGAIVRKDQVRFDLILKGRSAITASEYGMLEIEYVNGDDQKLKRMTVPVNDFGNSWRKVDLSRSPDAIKIHLAFVHVTARPKTLSLKGTIKLKANDAQSTIIKVPFEFKNVPLKK